VMAAWKRRMVSLGKRGIKREFRLAALY
jgi:hypothetical protein